MSELPAFKKFVSEDEIEEQKKKRQEEWEKVRKPDQPLGTECVICASFCKPFNPGKNHSARDNYIIILYYVSHLARYNYIKIE